MRQCNGRLLVVAASEGGPPVVHAILSQLSSHFPVPIIIPWLFESGAIDPICNALRKTTQIDVVPVDGPVSLLPGCAYVIPYGMQTAIELVTADETLTIRPQVANDREVDPFRELLLCACGLFGSGLKVALVGGMAGPSDSVLANLDVVEKRGADIYFVREPGAIVPPDFAKRISVIVNIRFLTADQFVVDVYEWCEPTENAHSPI